MPAALPIGQYEPSEHSSGSVVPDRHIVPAGHVPEQYGVLCASPNVFA